MARLWSTGSSALAVLAVLVALVSSKSTINRQVVKPLSAFGARLFRELCEQAGKDNVVVSPISAHMALSMLLLGADEGSETEREIKQALGCGDTDECLLDEHHQAYRGIMDEFKAVPQRDESRPIIDISNILVTKNQAPLNRTYQDEVERYYDASVTNIDDAKPQTKRNLLRRINKWAREAGFRRAPLSVETLDGDFAAMIMSSMKVEAVWKSQETYLKHRNLTGHKKFYNYGLADRGVQTTRFARSLLGQSFDVDRRLTSRSMIDFRVIMMGLTDELTLTIFEPRGTGKSRVPNLELDMLLDYLLTSKNGESGLDETLRVLDGHLYRVIYYLSMPRLKLENELDLVPALRALGVERAFGRSAEFSKISSEKPPNLPIERFAQSALIDVAVERLKAAATRTVRLPRALPPVWFHEIHIENPFFFTLRYEGLPLLMGRLTNI